MNKIDLIIDALYKTKLLFESHGQYPHTLREVNEALAAAHELKALQPVAWMEDSIEFYAKDHPTNSCTIPLYTAPPRKPWVGLTNEELVEIRETHQAHIFQLMFAVEAKVREKNT
jgi:hypothetical protein